MKGTSFYHTIHDADLIAEKAGTVDIVFGKYFFIHQPKERIRPMLEFSASMLRPGGKIVVDRQRYENYTGLMPSAEGWIPGDQWNGFVVERDWLLQNLLEVGFDEIKLTSSNLYVEGRGRSDILELVTATKTRD